MYSTSEEICKSFGEIITNLQSLEFVLRIFLDEIHGHPDQSKGAFSKLTKLKAGDWVPENYFTNYDSLDKLVNKVNNELRAHNFTEVVDTSIVNIRDAIAHGRILAEKPEGPFYLLKFSKPSDKKTQVTFSIEITSEWLSTQIKRSYEEIQKIIKISKTIDLKCFPNN